MSKPPSAAGPEKSTQALNDLAKVMDSAFKKNEKQNENEEEPTEEENAREVELEIRPPEGYTRRSLTVARCPRFIPLSLVSAAYGRIRHAKVWRAPAASTVETFTRNVPTLLAPREVDTQLCTHNSGWPCTPHEVGHFTGHASESGSGMPRPKRKAAAKPAATKSRDLEEEEDELVDDEDEQPNAKKRRMAVPSSVPPGTRGARLKAQISELESSIKRLQANVSKEVSKMQQMVQALTNEVRDLE
ncbi:hypothetical protein AX16_000166 [Volvariella volvacea WC 439]|nr:hypothetical protein AX16_000166 [Volvariella volvacea WC 439]